MSIISSFCHVSRSVADRDPAVAPDPDGADTLYEFAFKGVPDVAAHRGLFYAQLKDNGDYDTVKELTLTCAPGSSSCREGASLAG